jgi:hypothetical protein
MGYGRARGFGNYPGRGPFSNLPPWERPGYLYGRGTCLYFTQPVNTIQPAPAPLTKDTEAALLTQQKTAIETQLKAMQQTLEKIQTRLNEIKQ